MTTNDFDPTTNRVPYGLLTPEEQEALKAWPHEMEYYLLDGWRPIIEPSWENGVVYRGNPTPVVTSKWFNLYQFGLLGIPLNSRKEADECAAGERIAVLRIDTCNSVSTAHLEGV